MRQMASYTYIIARLFGNFQWNRQRVVKQNYQDTAAQLSALGLPEEHCYSSSTLCHCIGWRLNNLTIIRPYGRVAVTMSKASA